MNNANENKNKKQDRGLGRGLGSLLGGSADSGMMSAVAAPPRVIENDTAKSVNTQGSQLNVQVVKGSTKDLNTNKMVLKSIAPTEAKAPSSTSDQREDNKDAAWNRPAVETDTKNKVWMIAVDKVSPGEFQPRKEFEKVALQELAQSIRENGILQPIIVRKLASGKFEIVAGERRWRASQLAGLHEVPAIIKEFTDQKALELAIIENVQREDLNPIEEAEAYMKLSEDFNMSQQQIAERVGKERATIANALRLLALPRVVQNMVVQKELSVGHAKVLLSLPDVQKQIELAKQCVSEKLSVRKLEKRIADIVTQKMQKTSTEGDSAGSVTQKLIQGLAEELQRILSTKVDIDYKNSKGKLSIHFYSDDELTQLVDRIKK